MPITRDTFDEGGTGGEIGGGGTSGPSPAPTYTPTPGVTPTPTPTPTPSVSPPVTPPTSSIVSAVVASSERTGSGILVDQIPLQAVPSQRFTVQLGSQSCVIAVYQKSTGLYLDLAVGSIPVVTGALCRDRAWIIRDGYLGFSGDLAFVDTQGTDDPTYEGLGARFQLVWGH